MTVPATAENVRKSLIWREIASLYLKSEGLPATPAPRVRNPGKLGDVEGIDGWSLRTRNEIAYDLSEAMNVAGQVAEIEGNDLFASIIRRKGHDAGGAFVVMPLSVFSRVLKRLEDER